MARFDEYILDGSYTARDNVALNYFWIGFIIYALSFTLSTSTLVNYKVCQLFQILGLLLLLPAAFSLIRFKIDNAYLKITFAFYCLWQVATVARGFHPNYDFIKLLVFDGGGGVFIYLAPFILLFPNNLLHLKKAFLTIAVLGVFYLFYDLLFFKILFFTDGRDPMARTILENFLFNLSMPSGFVLLTYLYHSKQRNRLAALVILIALFFTILKARRSSATMNLAMLTGAYMIYYYRNKGDIIKILFSLLMLTVLFFYGRKVYDENRNGAFNLITERLYENTRTGVEICLYQDLTPTEWVIGKGINGTYYCPGIDPDDMTGYRKVIETGYLQMILNGGVVNVALFLMIALPAIIKGFFSSGNILSKAAAAWITFALLFSYPTIIHTFSLFYLLTWISIGICYSKTIRNLPERVVQAYLSNHLSFHTINP